jgi:hypothetical protein
MTEIIDKHETELILEKELRSLVETKENPRACRKNDGPHDGMDVKNLSLYSIAIKMRELYNTTYKRDRGRNI